MNSEASRYPTDGSAQNENPRDLGAIILRNTLVVAAGTWLTRIFNFLFIIYAVRTLGEDGLGRYATVISFVGLFSVFSELGMAQYVERSIAQKPSRVQDLFWDLVVLRAILALFGILGISLVALRVYDTEIANGVFLFSLTFLLSSLLAPLGIILTANERFDLATLVGLIGQLITISLGILLLWLGHGIFALLLTGFVAMPIQIVVTARLIKRHQLGPLPFRIHPDRWKQFIRLSLPFGITSLALTLNYNVDTVILGFFWPQSEVGWYNASYRLVVNAVSVVGAFLVVMTPSLAREHQHFPERVQAWVRTSIHWMMVFGIPAAAGLSIVAASTVRFLYGQEFETAGTTVAIIAWDIPLYVLLSFFGNVTAATGRERPAAAIYVGSATANVILNLIFIPFFGMYAAATITVASDLLTVVLFLVLLRETIQFRSRFSGTLVRAGTATLVMMLSMWILRELPYPVLIALGGTVYLLSAVLLRLINPTRALAGVRGVFRHLKPQRSKT